MRVALIDFKDVITENDKNQIMKQINKDYKECIFFDIFSDDVDEAEYCLDIRMYDLIVINFRSVNYNKYYNIMSILDKYYELEYKVCIYHNLEEKMNFSAFQSRIKEIYKKVQIDYLGSFHSKEELTKDIVELTEKWFLNTPIVNNMSIDHENRVLKLETKHGEVTIDIKKNIDYQILIYFMRHYGEVININSILSAITAEPELMNNSPIESSISSIRKLFSLNLGLNPIKAFKRVGYQFSIK